MRSGTQTDDEMRVKGDVGVKGEDEVRLQLRLQWTSGLEWLHHQLAAPKRTKSHRLTGPARGGASYRRRPVGLQSLTAGNYGDTAPLVRGTGGTGQATTALPKEEWAIVL